MKVVDLRYSTGPIVGLKHGLRHPYLCEVCGESRRFLTISTNDISTMCHACGRTSRFYYAGGIPSPSEVRDPLVQGYNYHDVVFTIGGDDEAD